METQLLRIGALARLTGCNIETIRYYERIALVPAPPRAGRYRSYGLQDLKRLRFIRRARTLGFTLDQIRTLLALEPRPAETCMQAREVAELHLGDVRTKIVALQAMEQVLAKAVKACAHGGSAGCAIIEALSD